jgi:hypothetical protein
MDFVAPSFIEGENINADATGLNTGMARIKITSLFFHKIQPYKVLRIEFSIGKSRIP